MKALEVKALDRYQTMEEFSAAMEEGTRQWEENERKGRDEGNTGSEEKQVSEIPKQIAYPVTGENIYFDPHTGTIERCDTTITRRP